MRKLPRWTKRLQDGFDLAEFSAHIREWADILGLQGWEIRFGLGKVDDDERGHVEVAAIERMAVIRLDNGIPTSQVDRVLVHELAHILMADMEDTFNRSLVEHGEQAQAFLRGQWKRAQEPVCERLAELLTDSRREEWKEQAGDWRDAFPVSKP